MFFHHQHYWWCLSRFSHGNGMERVAISEPSVSCVLLNDALILKAVKESFDKQMRQLQLTGVSTRAERDKNASRYGAARLSRVTCLTRLTCLRFRYLVNFIDALHILLELLHLRLSHPATRQRWAKVSNTQTKGFDTKLIRS